MQGYFREGDTIASVDGIPLRGRLLQDVMDRSKNSYSFDVWRLQVCAFTIYTFTHAPPLWRPCPLLPRPPSLPVPSPPCPPPLTRAPPLMCCGSLLRSLSPCKRPSTRCAELFRLIARSDDDAARPTRLERRATVLWRGVRRGGCIFKRCGRLHQRWAGLCTRKREREGTQNGDTRGEEMSVICVARAGRWQVHESL